MVKKILTLLTALLAICIVTLFTSCNRYEYWCDSCNEWKSVSLRLINGIDMQLCDSCYTEYNTAN